ncbi:Replication factor A protein 2 [Malassezia brasiliensis]|uniref:Replication factor A protein 2 n=1 Tax=Malassezia brasiliensis TaxID=1821822 RepID=A0AAF0DQJ2_9BASI|nr:Replication factor A protein 2 [Malassezia brasiliensis]
MEGYGDNPFGQNYSTGGGNMGGGGFFGGANGSQEGGRRVGTNSLRPVTVRQVLNASQPHSDAPFTFDNAELSQVTLVAWIQNISRNATNVSYTLDDGTGQLDVRQWIDNSMDEGAKVDEFHTNEYVRVLGEVKSFNNKRSVTAASIARLEDHNEYLFHQLDVIYTHLQLAKGSGASTKALGHNQDASAYDDTSVAIDASSADLSHLTPLQRRIYSAITAEAPDYPEGVDVQQIVARCKNADPAQIQDAIDELANDGYIYQASDETHYLTTAG